MKKTIGLIALLLCVAMPAWAKATGASKPSTSIIPVLPPIVANYDVYVGGVHLIAAEVLFEEQNGTYRSRVHAHTYGFWYKMLPWDNVIEVNGKLKNDKFVPLDYRARDDWNHNPKTTKFRFRKNDVVAEFDPPSHDENREVVTKAQRRGSLDPASALLQMLAHVAIYKSCDVVVPVFDGKRRFDVKGVDKEPEYIDEESYGIFKGDARVCSAEFTMIAGEWKDRKPSKFWQKSETENGRDPFQIYLAPVGPNNLDLAFRLESTSVFGLIVGHLTSWHYASVEEIK